MYKCVCTYWWKEKKEEVYPHGGRIKKQNKNGEVQKSFDVLCAHTQVGIEKKSKSYHLEPPQWA